MTTFAQRVSLEPGPVRDATPPGSPIRFSDYDLDTSDALAGGAAWVEGELVPVSEARISLFDTGFGHSDVTYTVVQVWHGSFFRLGEHLDRLLEGAQRLRIEPGHSKEELAEIAIECVRRSQLREAYVNLTISRGFGRIVGEKDLTKLNAQTYAYAIPYRWNFPLADQLDGGSVIVPRHVRRSGRSTIDPTIKNYQWGDLTAGLFEARDRGAHSAILLDSDNCVAEGAGFNVVVVKDGALASPARNALPGITRATVLELADRMGLPAELRDIPSSELYAADELMAVTTAGGVTPLVSLDGEPVSGGVPGPITVAIRDRYWALMDERSPWVEPVDY